MAGKQDQLTAKGEWWIAGNDAHKARGTLVVDDHDGGTLALDEPISSEWYGKLVEQMPTGSTSIYDQLVPDAVIQGQSNGRSYTLLDCEVPVEPSGGVILTIEADAVVVGALLASGTSPSVCEFRIAVENLAAFVGQSTLEPTADGSDIRRHSLDPITAQVDGMTISIAWIPLRGGRMTRMGRSVELGETVVLDLSCTNPLSIDEVGVLRRRLQDLVTFVTGVASSSTVPRLRLASASHSTENRGTTLARLFQPWPNSPEDPDGVVVPAQLVLRSEDIPWQQLISAWFASYEKLRPVLGTLLGHRFLPFQFVENKALHLIIAAEQIYRNLGDSDFFMPEKQLSRLRHIVRHAVGADETLAPHVDRVIEELHRRITLDERLRALVAYVGDAAEILLGGPSGIERWIVAAKRVRNDLGHTGHTTRVSIPALGAIARSTEALLELVIAKMVGLSHEGLSDLVLRRHWRVTSQVARHLGSDDTNITS